MNYTLTRSQRKTLSIIIRDGKVIVKAPMFLDQSQIDHFVASKEAWILGKLEVYERPGIDLSTDTHARIFGDIYELSIIKNKQFSVHMDSEDKHLIISKPESMSFDLANRKLEDLFKERLIMILEDYVPYYAARLQLKTPPIKVRRYKRIHGRCSSKGELAFNTYLFHESIDFIKYVILHECAHLIEFNHSAAFYALIEAHMPDYKRIIASSKLKDTLHQDQ